MAAARTPVDAAEGAALAAAVETAPERDSRTARTRQSRSFAEPEAPAAHNRARPAGRGTASDAVNVPEAVVRETCTTAPDTEIVTLSSGQKRLPVAAIRVPTRGLVGVTEICAAAVGGYGRGVPQTSVTVKKALSAAAAGRTPQQDAIVSIPKQMSTRRTTPPAQSMFEFQRSIAGQAKHNNDVKS